MISGGRWCLRLDGVFGSGGSLSYLGSRKTLIFWDSFGMVPQFFFVEFFAAVH